MITHRCYVCKSFTECVKTVENVFVSPIAYTRMVLMICKKCL